MELRQLEETLNQVRTKYSIRLYSGNRSILQPCIIENIESGRNYYLSTLLKYLNALGFTLKLNDLIIEDLVTLGNFLRTLRENAGLSMNQVKSSRNKRLREVKQLEEGSGGSRTTFLGYINELQNNNINLDFKLIDNYGITKGQEGFEDP